MPAPLSPADLKKKKFAESIVMTVSGPISKKFIPFYQT
jgi:hypothetical protein